MFDEKFQRGIGEIEVEVAVADEIANLATHDGKKRLGRLVVDGWWSLRPWAYVEVAHVGRSSAVPGGNQQRGLDIIRHLANPIVEDDQGPPQSATHLGLESSASGVGRLVMDAHALCDADSDAKHGGER